MTEGNLSSGKKFKKRSHRPWKPDLLSETVGLNNNSTSTNKQLIGSTDATVDNASSFNSSQLLQDIDSIENLKHTIAEQIDSLTNYKTPNSPTAAPQFNAEFSQPFIDNPNASTSIEHKKPLQNQQPQTLGIQNSMNFGGFFQPTNVAATSDINDAINSETEILDLIVEEDEPQYINKTTQLMDELRVRETEINSLTANLRISQALEKAEQAELARKMEERSRISAEKRMKQAFEQANSTAQQIKIAMKKAQEEELARQHEEQQRQTAESLLAEVKEKAKHLEEALATERSSRGLAEEKAQHALNQTVQTELSRQNLDNIKKELDNQLQSTIAQLNKTELARKSEEAARLQTERKLQALFQDKSKLEQLYQEEKVKLQLNFQTEVQKLKDAIAGFKQDKMKAIEQTAGMGSELQLATEQTKQTKEKLQTLLSQRDKLQAINKSEKELRIISENKAKEALAQAAQAEIALQTAERQKRLIDERAKRAISHASKTVMHFLNAPIDDTLEAQVDKLKEDSSI